MRKYYLLLICCLTFSSILAQSVGINTDGSSADASSILDVKSTAAGVLFPRMTQVQRDAITTPAEGLMVYQTDNTPGFRYWDGSTWKLFLPVSAIIKNVRPSLTGNQTSTATTWNVININTLEGDLSFISLTSNQFTLEPGSYLIEGSSPYHSIGKHQARIYNATDAVVEFLGTSGAGDSPETSRSNYKGIISITSQKTFEIQHWTTLSGNFGTVVDNSSNEIDTVLKITKLQ